MKCPIDAAELVMSERQGVEIDYCPQCRGVWLDRGELDKILDRAAEAAPPVPAPGAGHDRPEVQRPSDPLQGTGAYADLLRGAGAYGDARREPDRYRDERYRDERYRDDRRPYKKKKESWLSDILDFG